MLHVRSPWDNGPHGVVVDVECHMSNGLPGITIVGYANRAVDEAKERIRSAFASAKLEMPRKRITINLAPADIPKESTSFDTGLATAILAASRQINRLPDKTEGTIGEIGLDGTIRPVRGVIGKILAGKRKGIKTFILPRANLGQAKLIPDIKVVPVTHLKDIAAFYTDGATANHQEPEAIETGSGALPDSIKTVKPDIRLSDVIGQARAKRALEIAAAGGHNILLNGPPGTGKSMLAKALPAILPPMDHKEIVEVTHLHSLASTTDYDQIVTTRPFRSPHHSASHVAIVGGGHNLRPGEISLSHRGVLFFDELPEFSRMTVEALRQPLEDHTITIARAKETASYPANFILVTTSNPCPCGYFGTEKTCRCSAHEIQRYRRKLSGPILDRIDLYVEVEEVAHERLLASAPDTASTDDASVQDRVMQARQLQKERFGKDVKLNSLMSNRDIKQHADITDAAKELLDTAAHKLDISARSYMRTLKVARTIADLDHETAVGPTHVSEALQYRSHNYHATES